MVAMALAVSAARASEPLRQNPSPPTRDRQVGRAPTPDDILEALRRSRPPNDVIPPASAPERSASSRKHPLMPEGSTVVDRSASLVQEGEWWRVNLAGEAEESYRLLPNVALEQMVRVARAASLKIRFLLSGEFTVFDGENYLLVRSAGREQPSTSAAGNETDSKASKPPATPSDASANDVLAVLREQQPERVALGSGGTDAKAPQAAATTLGRIVFLDGTALGAKPARLVRQGSWWALVQESNDPEGLELDLRALPNQPLEQMVQYTQRNPADAVFLVSGEVTAFEGRNFLLVRSAMHQMDLGNLRK